VLVDTLFDVTQQVPPDQIDAMTKRLETDYAGPIRQFVTEYLFAPDTPASVREQVLNHATAIPADLSTAMLRESWVYDPLSALRDIKAPIRAVNSDKFPTNREANRRYMPGFEVIILRGTGHYPMLEDPEPFSRALARALADVSR
jgi:pimeloyl-ACP methyl ester carboxylesterase